MKWPKSEEKIEIGGGGLEKLGALQMASHPIANVWLRHCVLHIPINE